MATRNARLDKLEQKLRPRKPVETLGYYETHFTNAWPAARDMPGVEARQCTEHGPTCAVKTTLISAPMKRVLILEGATAEDMGSDE